MFISIIGGLYVLAGIITGSAFVHSFISKNRCWKYYLIATIILSILSYYILRT